MFKFNIEIAQIKRNFAYHSESKKYNERYPEEYAYFNKLLNQVNLIPDISNIDSIIDNKLYSKGNISIVLDNDFTTKMSTNGITNDKFMKTIKENIEDISRYSDIDTYNKAKFDINYDSRNDIIKDRLLERKQTLQKITKNKTDNAKLLELFPEMKNTQEIFDKFNFDDLDDDLDLNTPKNHIMYLSKLNELFNNREYQEINGNQLEELNIWHKPILNTPRDYNLVVESRKELSDFTQYFVSPELRLMNFLLQNQFILNKFNKKDIDYILSVYRCFTIGNNIDLRHSVAFNSKYYDVWPCFGLVDCKNDVCEKYKIGWSIENNAIGTLLAARRRIIFPYMIISDNLGSSRYETIKFNSDLNIGIIILKILIEDDKYIYHYYYIRIINDTIGFFDIYNNSIYFKTSPSAQPRVQLLESKWAIYKLLWYLSFRKIIPYTQREGCDILLYKTNRKISIPNREDKDIYLLSIYNKDEIRKMYMDLLDSIKIFELNKLYKDLQILIQTFILELDSYTILTKYRLFNTNNCNKLFVWEIDPSERLQWGEFDNIVNCIEIYKGSIPTELGRISCIKSNLYISMDKEILNHDKVGIDRDKESIKIGDSLTDILIEPFDKYFPIKYYYKSIDYNYNDIYKNTVDNYIKNLNRLYFKIYYNFINY